MAFSNLACGLVRAGGFSGWVRRGGPTGVCFTRAARGIDGDPSRPFRIGLQSQLPWIHILGKEVARLPNTSSIVFRGCDRQSLQMAFDLRGLACSTGSACASGSSQPSHVLQAMGLPEDWVQGGLRFSNSFETTEEEVDRAVQIIVETTRHLNQG